MVDITI